MFVRLLKIFLPVAFGVAAFQTAPSFALSDHVVITQVQAGASTASANGDAAATQEVIVIFNNSNAPVDVTNWCFTNKLNVSFACFSAPNSHVTLQLASHAFAFVASDSYVVRNGVTPDATFVTTNKTSGSLTGGSDTVSLIDANGTVVDSAAWSSVLAGGSVLARSITGDGTYADTDSVADFKKMMSLVIPVSGLSEVVHIIDECTNIDGPQSTIPVGYSQIADGSCVHDACSNISGLQVSLPKGYKYGADEICLMDVPFLKLSELLPNATGTDDGNEFIELFNPNDDDVTLENYRLMVGQNLEKTYVFPKDAAVKAHGYATYFNSDIPFTLLNTSSQVAIATTDGQLIDTSTIYTDPAEDNSWAFINEAWQFTNQATPGLPNLLSIDDVASPVSQSSTSSLKACASNQYRNPETNRCRVIESSSSLTPCKDGQYRSEETNRCRSISTDAASVKACADNQFRNPDTGRCKKFASEDEVKDCGEGRERNPATNRCRNVISTASGTVGSGVKLVAAPAANIFGWWAAGIVGFVAVGYAVLEWRQEIIRLFWRIVRHFKPAV